MGNITCCCLVMMEPSRLCLALIVTCKVSSSYLQLAFFFLAIREDALILSVSISLFNSRICLMCSHLAC